MKKEITFDFTPASKTETKFIQNELLKLLVEFDGICKQNNIEYYLDGGTVLGAVRHSGFIPWDDDIDICIKHSEFIKLKKILETEIGPNRVFSYFDQEYTHNRLFARYINSEIPHILKSVIVSANYEPGIFIDIFILDGTTKDHLKQHIKNLECSGEITHKYLNGVLGSISLTKYIAFQLAEKILSDKKVLQHVDKKLSLHNHPDKKVDYYIPRNGWNYGVYTEDVFQTPKEVYFEGHKLPIPSKPEKYLREHYGLEWYKLPEKEERFSRHYTVADITITTSEFMRKYNWLKDIKKVLKLQELRHLIQILRKKHIVNRQLKLASIQAKIISHIVNGKLKHELIEGLFNAQDFKGIMQEFEMFEQEQKKLLKKFMYAPTAIEIDNKTLNQYLYGLLLMGETLKVEKIISRSKSFKDLYRIQSSCALLKKLEQQMQDQEHEEAKTILSEISHDLEISVTVIKYKEKLNLTNLNDSEKLDTYNKISEKIGKNHEIEKLKADILLKNNKTDEAFKIYNEIIQKHDNQILIQECKQILASTQVNIA